MSSLSAIFISRKLCACAESSSAAEASSAEASDNSALVVARQMLEANPQCGIGKNSRVTFVLTAQGSCRSVSRGEGNKGDRRTALHEASV